MTIAYDRNRSIWLITFGPTDTLLNSEWAPLTIYASTTVRRDADRIEFSMRSGWSRTSRGYRKDQHVAAAPVPQQNQGARQPLAGQKCKQTIASSSKSKFMFATKNSASMELTEKSVHEANIVDEGELSSSLADLSSLPDCAANSYLGPKHLSGWLVDARAPNAPIQLSLFDDRRKRPYLRGQGNPSPD